MALTKDDVKGVLSDIYDPEMHIDIVTLGLIYDIKVNDDDDVNILMTLTFPGCPYGPAIIDEINEKVKAMKGVRNVEIEVTFEPAWSPEKIDPEVKAALGI